MVYLLKIIEIIDSTLYQKPIASVERRISGYTRSRVRKIAYFKQNPLLNTVRGKLFKKGVLYDYNSAEIYHSESNDFPPFSLKISQFSRNRFDLP